MSLAAEIEAIADPDERLAMALDVVRWLTDEGDAMTAELMTAHGIRSKKRARVLGRLIQSRGLAVTYPALAMATESTEGSVKVSVHYLIHDHGIPIERHGELGARLAACDADRLRPRLLSLEDAPAGRGAGWLPRRAHEPWTDQERAAAAQMAARGYPAIRIAHDLGRTQRAVERTLTEARHGLRD